MIESPMRVKPILVQLMAAALPGRLKRALLRWALGWSIGEGTRLGFSLLLCERVTIGADCRIGHCNMFRRLRVLEIGPGTLIGNFNDFMSGDHTGWPASLRIGFNSHVTSHHFFDCSGGIRIGDWSLVGGRNTQLWTHFYDSHTVHTRPLSIGDRCYICARATLVYCHVPNDCVVAAGAVVNKDFSQAGPGLLLAGNPATARRKPRY
jgi:acetyltransferase-like isoleucine patch superfamily enzyme